MIKFVECKSLDEIGQKVGAIFIHQVKTKPTSTLLLATGSSPIPVYNAIIDDHLKNKTNWSQVITFNLDEYLNLNPEWAEQSYQHFMFKHLFKNINIDMENVHFPSAHTLQGKYEELINETGGIDLTILGVGINGHIAFNEPGTPINSMTHVVTLDEITRQANARFFSNNITDVPSEAVSCGLDTILQSKQIVLVASGKNKKDAIDHLRHAKTFDPKWPITALVTHKHVSVYTYDLE